MLALYMRQREIADLLLSANPKLDLFEAAALGNTDRVAALINQDRTLANGRSSDGFTPLHLACFFAQEAAAHLLLEHGAQPDAVANNAMKVTPLHSAAAGRSAAIVRDLLEHGAPPNARQESGWTALHEAAQSGNKEMLDVLLQHGADPNLKNDKGISALQLAMEKGHVEIAQRLGAA
jgi:ankyrin repeat protein